MESRISARTRNIIVYILLCLTIIGVTISLVLAQVQDEQFVQDAQLYQTVDNNMKNGDYEGAGKILKTLLDTHPDSYMIQWKYALNLAAQKDYAQANEYFLKAQKQRPFIVRNQQYLVQFGDVLYKQGNYMKAKKYFEEAKRINTDPQLSMSIEPTINEINKKLQIKQ